STARAPIIYQAMPKSKNFVRRTDALLPLPALRGERVGVRGSLHERACGESPSPGLLRNPTSPRRRGEVIQSEPGPPMAFYFVQFLTGLASAASLFLVASGLSIIFGVTRIVNFAHGAFYMLGAYVAF